MEQRMPIYHLEYTGSHIVKYRTKERYSILSR